MFANEFSQKEMDLVKKNMTMHMGKGHGPTEYMDGGTWVKLLVKYEYVVIPSIPINLQPTARIVQRVILDMTCITSVDIGNSEIPREKLCLALSSLALVLWLVLIDLKRHGVIKIENMSLYVHHWLSCIPRLFENKDFSDYVTQDFERMFHFSKTTERMTNHNANNIGVEIIKRDQCESNRKRRFRTRHGYSGDGELSAWRLENPLTNITLSPYLASVYSAEVVAYFNGRITNSSFGYERGTDYEHCTDGSIVFKVNGVSSAGNYNYTNESASLSEVVKIQPWMTCKRENDMEFYTRLSGQPGSDLLFYKVPQLKRFLYDAGVLKPTGSKPQLVDRVRGYLNLPWGDQRRGSYLEWLSGSPTVVEGGLVGDDKSRYGLVPFTPPPQRKNRKRKHTEAVLFSLCELQRTLHRQGNHPYVPCRKALQTAFWVVPFDASTTTPWQCMPPPENPFEGSNAVRTVAEVYTQVTGGEHRFVSLTLDKPWAVFSTLKSVLQNAKAGGMVVEVDLTKVGHIYNLSTEEAGLFFSLDTEALCQCWSSSEIFVSAVPDSALTGQGWFISLASGPGREVIGVHGSDRILNADGSIRVFGRYGLWREAFSAFVEKKSGPVALFNGLRCVRPDE
uniref:Uncharacterized protein n=1 Tax=Octactis speculum TaxID=3111310 RepID=A0A7S2D6G4_9STRA|mmetsp:Transcript_44041/g.60147  ORF Transcript_44041/g.60147 Transcript_44041/m.60147 type:complete len:621 (+) Transcript_44041:254-2116(+)